MAKFTANGLEAYIEDTGASATVTTSNIVSFTAASPTTITLTAGQGTSWAVGDFAIISGTGTKLDGGAYKVGTKATDTLTLTGADTTGYAGSLTPTGASAKKVASGAMLRFCLSGYEREIAAADAVDVSTFCGPESLAGTPQPGNINIEGFIDYQVAAYNEWREGVGDGLQRLFRVVLPTKVGGEITMIITPSGLTETFAVNEAASFTGTAVIAKPPVYITPP